MEFLFCLAEKWRMDRVKIFEEQFAKGCHVAILLICFFPEYRYSGLVYVTFANFEPQHHEQIEFGDGSICSCHLSVFEQRGRLLGGR